jgi:hypothetical protein
VSLLATAAPKTLSRTWNYGRLTLPVKYANLCSIGLHSSGLAAIIRIMAKKKTKQESDEALLASVTKEMAGPRMAHSAREECARKVIPTVEDPVRNSRASSRH